MKLSADDISRLSLLVNEVSGIQWDASKSYLMETRLIPLLKTFGMNDFGELVSRIRSGANAQLRTAFVDAITTRETLFFRDDSPFQSLEHKALPEIMDAKQGTPFAKRLRFWSAACSSGQEPYSLAILLHEMLEDIDRWDIQILATDLAPAALATASRGVYSDFELSRGISPEIRGKYFDKTTDGWQVKDRLKKLVRFEQRNLLESFGMMGPFDVIFCRNVAIYFDLEVRKDLFERLSKTLANHGTLFVGCSENLSGYGDKWKPLFHCRSTYYQPNKKHPEFEAREAVTPPKKTTTGLPATANRLATPAPAKPIIAKPVISGIR